MGSSADAHTFTLRLRLKAFNTSLSIHFTYKFFFVTIQTEEIEPFSPEYWHR